MMIALVACLVIVALYLARRLSVVNVENAALRDQIAALKKQLVRRRTPVAT
jgi:hypothetical protein